MGLFICRILVLCLVCVIALAPFYVAFCYAFKSKVEIAKTKLAFPTRPVSWEFCGSYWSFQLF